CSNCFSINSPSWRRDNDGKLLLCNACGLYQKLHNKPRPWYIAKDGTVKVLRPTTSHQKCWNCGVTETPLWRRNDAGKIVCNACGLFLKQTKGNRKVAKK
ncbi:GATA-domain-containing protein, partial [Basidiobolus meristosporus CBS 931.73]